MLVGGPSREQVCARGYVCTRSKHSGCHRLIQKYRYQQVPSTTWLSACFYSLNVRRSIESTSRLPTTFDINLERSVSREPGVLNLGIHLFAAVLFAVERERDKGRLVRGERRGRKRGRRWESERERESASERASEHADWQVHWTRLRSRAASIDTTRVIVPPKGVCVAVIATAHHFLTSYLGLFTSRLSFNSVIGNRIFVLNDFGTSIYFKVQRSKWFIFTINNSVLWSSMLKPWLT